MEQTQNNTTQNQQENVPELKVMDTIANLMDNAIPVPFTKHRFGLDAIMGLVPNVGDIASLGISGLLILTILKHGVSFKVLLQMIWNIVLDASVGTIPILGDFFDFRYKANRKNAMLLKAHYAEGGSRMNPWLAAMILLVIVIAVTSLMFYFAAKIVSAIWTMIMSQL